MRTNRSHPTSKEPAELDMSLLEKLPNVTISGNTKDPREDDKDVSRTVFA